MDALNYLEKWELSDLLKRDDLLQMLRNGGIFPDGGYAVKVDYGETGHWKLFFLTY